MNIFDMSDGKMTGFELAVLSSADAADAIIKEFKCRYCGQEPQFLLDAIVEEMNISTDIFPEDVERVKEAICNYLEEIGE